MVSIRPVSSLVHTVWARNFTRWVLFRFSHARSIHLYKKKHLFDLLNYCLSLIFYSRSNHRTKYPLHSTINTEQITSFSGFGGVFRVAKSNQPLLSQLLIPIKLHHSLILEIISDGNVLALVLTVGPSQRLLGSYRQIGHLADLSHTTLGSYRQIVHLADL